MLHVILYYIILYYIVAGRAADGAEHGQGAARGELSYAEEALYVVLCIYV